MDIPGIGAETNNLLTDCSYNILKKLANSTQLVVATPLQIAYQPLTGAHYLQVPSVFS